MTGRWESWRLRNVGGNGRKGSEELWKGEGREKKELDGEGIEERFRRTQIIEGEW